MLPLSNKHASTEAISQEIEIIHKKRRGARAFRAPITAL
jgi:hypothetical protein